MTMAIPTIDTAASRIWPHHAHLFSRGGLTAIHRRLTGVGMIIKQLWLMKTPLIEVEALRA